MHFDYLTSDSQIYIILGIHVNKYFIKCRKILKSKYIGQSIVQDNVLCFLPAPYPLKKKKKNKVPNSVMLLWYRNSEIPGVLFDNKDNFMPTRIFCYNRGKKNSQTQHAFKRMQLGLVSIFTLGVPDWHDKKY